MSLNACSTSRAQEAARLALLTSTAAGDQPPAELDFDNARMQLRRISGGFGAVTDGLREGNVEPVPRRADDGPDLATTSFDSVATDGRPTMATCVDELQQMLRQESVGYPDATDHPFLPNETVSLSFFRMDSACRSRQGQPERDIESGRF